MTVYIHREPIDDQPTPTDLREMAAEADEEEFVAWLLERKGKATGNYFRDHWGIDPDQVEYVCRGLEEEGIVEVRSYR